MLQFRHCLLLLCLVSTSLISARDFDMDTAIRGVYYSKIAYCFSPHIQEWTCSACPKFPKMQNVTVAVDADHDAAAWTGYNPEKNEIVLAFRGTENLQGWIVDLDFPQVDFVISKGNCSGCKVHEGFYWAWLRLRPTIVTAMQSLAAAFPNASLLVTGHSLGAAMAEIGYAEVLDTLVLSGPQRLYNYGSPRVGNPQLVGYLQTIFEPRGEHYRCTNFGDPVPHLPPTFFDQWGGIWGDWLHIPREVFFTNPFVPPQQDYRVCNGNATAEDPTCADSTPWYDMLSFVNHTTYLDIGLGCFL